MPAAAQTWCLQAGLCGVRRIADQAVPCRLMWPDMMASDGCQRAKIGSGQSRKDTLVADNVLAKPYNPDTFRHPRLQLLQYE